MGSIPALWSTLFHEIVAFLWALHIHRGLDGKKISRLCWATKGKNWEQLPNEERCCQTWEPNPGLTDLSLSTQSQYHGFNFTNFNLLIQKWSINKKPNKLEVHTGPYKQGNLCQPSPKYKTFPPNHNYHFQSMSKIEWWGKNPLSGTKSNILVTILSMMDYQFLKYKRIMTKLYT